MRARDKVYPDGISAWWKLTPDERKRLTPLYVRWVEGHEITLEDYRMLLEQRSELKGVKREL